MLLVLLLLKDVAEDAAFLSAIVFPCGPQFIEHASRNERGGHNLRRRVIEFLSRHAAEVLEDADILEADVSLQVLDALPAQRQVFFDLTIVRIPQVTIMAGILHNHLVRADRLHGVVESVAGAAGIAINAIERMRMHHRARRPRTAVYGRRGGNHLQWQTRLRAKGAAEVGRGGALGLVSADNPRTRDRIFAQFHRSLLYVQRHGSG